MLEVSIWGLGLKLMAQPDSRRTLNLMRFHPHTTAKDGSGPMENPMTSHRRGPWSTTEDAFLIQMVQSHGPLNWVRISQTIGSRTPKQCRERYHQNLKPSLNHKPITPEEGLQIEFLVHEMGKRWAEIARQLHGRSDNAVKNWWNESQNRRKRLDRRRAVAHSPAAPSHVYAQAQARSQTFFEDRCPHAAPLPMARPGGLSRACSTACPRSPAADSPVLYQPNIPWGEVALPSPCSSEPAESDVGSNYTTSPAGNPRVLEHLPLKLPPLRSCRDPRPRGARLPSLSSLSYHGPQSWSLPRPRAPGQLPTAPNSPVQNSEEQQQARYEAASRDKDSRMELATLLA